MSSLQEGEGVAGLSRTQAVAAAAGALVLLYAGAVCSYLVWTYTAFGICTCIRCMGQRSRCISR